MYSSIENWKKSIKYVKTIKSSGKLKFSLRDVKIIKNYVYVKYA